MPVKKRLIVVLCALVVGYWWVFLDSESPQPLRPGPDTTYFTEPLDADGFVDFAAALNARQTSLPPERNAAYPLMRLVGENPAQSPEQRARLGALMGRDLPATGSGTFIRFGQVVKDDSMPDQGPDHLPDENAGNATATPGTGTGTGILPPPRLASRQPWLPSEFPEVAAWLDQNQVALQDLTEAAHLDGFYLPLIPGSPVSEWSTSFFDRQNVLLPALRAMQARGLRKWAEGDVPGAKDDLMTVVRVCHHLADTDHLFLYLVGTLACREVLWQMVDLIRDREKGTNLATSLLAELEKQPPFPTAVKPLTAALFLPIAQIHELARHPASSPGLLGAAGLPHLKAFDFNAMLSVYAKPRAKALDALNQASIPKALTAFREAQTVTAQQRNAVSGMNIAWRWLTLQYLTNRWVKARLMSQLVGEILFAIATPDQTGIFAESTINRELTNLLRIACALRRSHDANGAYPEDLGQPLPGLASLPIDIYAEAPHRFRREGNGYLLYSIGPDLKDNDGTPLPKDATEPGDLVIRGI